MWRRKDAPAPGENFRQQGTSFSAVKIWRAELLSTHVWDQAESEQGLETRQLLYVCFPGPVLRVEGTKMNRVIA